jgi:hypothetical protein
MAKRHGRPSAQYRYEHYDPTGDSGSGDSSGSGSSDNQGR